MSGGGAEVLVGEKETFDQEYFDLVRRTADEKIF